MKTELLEKAQNIKDRIDYCERLLGCYNKHGYFLNDVIMDFLVDNADANCMVQNMMKECLEKELADLKAQFEAL